MRIESEYGRMSAMKRQMSIRTTPRGKLQSRRARLAICRTAITRSGSIMSEARTDYHGVISALVVSLGEKYSHKKAEVSHHSNNGKHIDLEVAFSVVKESFVAVSLGIGPFSIDLGLKMNYMTETVGGSTLILSYDCCD